MSAFYFVSPMDGHPCPMVIQTLNGRLRYGGSVTTGSASPSEQILLPGQSIEFPIWLPTNTIRWQISFDAHSATLRDRLAFKILHSKWCNQLPVFDWAWGSLQKAHEKIEIVSNSFEVEKKVADSSRK
jgi:hypothetical protein